MAKTVKYLEGLTIHKVPYNIANTSDFKINVMGKAADNELFIITDTPTFSLKIGNVTYDGTSNVSAPTATQSASGLMSAADKTALDGKLDKTGGTLTGNLTGKYLTGTWLQTTASTDLGRTPGKVAVLDDSGWVYYRTPAELKSDIGANGYLPTAGGTMTGAITTKGIKLTSGTDFGSSLPSSMQSNQLFFQTLGSNYILDNVYPVGSIYMSVNSTNPKNLFGGTWEQIQGKFLFGMNSSYPAGSTGGEITHKLTWNEMPGHYHEGLYYSYQDTKNLITLNTGSASYHIPWGSSDYAGDYGAGTGKKELITGSAGSGEAHNNMPPYLSVYIWKRTK